MDYVIYSLGTYGDNLPFIKLASELKKRGREVAFVGNDKFEGLCSSKNIHFISVSSAKEYEDTYGDLATWSSTHSKNHYIEFHLPALQKSYNAIEKLVNAGHRPHLIYQDIFSGANLAAEKFRLKRTKVALAPSAVFSAVSPPFPLRTQIMEKDWVEGMAIVKEKAKISSLKKIVDPYLNPIRKGLGLDEIALNNINELDQCDNYLGLFPSWLKPRPKDWPENFVTCGFPFTTGSPTALSVEVENFLTRYEKPIVATFGSGLPPTRGNITKLSKIGKKLGKGVIFVSPKQPSERAYGEDENLLIIREADYSCLFPKAGLIMHHGGIGTTADSIQAGIPQLITPFNFDQPDNAFLIYELGLGNAVQFMEASVPEIAQQAAAIINDPQIAKNCHDHKQRFFNEDGVNNAANQIENTLKE